MTQQRHSPGPGQESVWDYPRPPLCQPSSRVVTVVDDGQEIAASSRSYRVLETSHPPVYYIPADDIQMQLLCVTARTSWCEWKGRAIYHSLQRGDQQQVVAWSYPEPTAAFAEIRDYLAFYPSKVDQCFVDGERVQAQPGDFYGGWITSDVVGPFKGAPGTMGW